MAYAAHHHMSFAEYLAIEAESPIKHEFLDGQVWAMAGGSRRRGAIAANILRILGNQLQAGSCQAHSSDVRIRVLATGLATYPDGSIICGRAELDPDDDRGESVTNPIVLIEVLSPSTAEYDEGEKLEHYKRIASLWHVVIAAQDDRRIDVWTRGEDGSWAVVRQVGSAVAQLRAIRAELPLDGVYRDPLL
jgi:Uma2 family endonuclease